MHLEIIAHRSTGLHGILFPSVVSNRVYFKLGLLGREKEKENKDELWAHNFKDSVNSVLNMHSVAQT